MFNHVFESRYWQYCLLLTVLKSCTEKTEIKRPGMVEFEKCVPRQSFQKCLFLLWTPKIFSWQDGDDAKLLILSPHFQGEIWTSQSLVGWKWNNNFEPKTFFFLSLTPSFGSLFHSFPHLQISFFQFKSLSLSLSLFHTHSASTFCKSFSLPHIPHTFTNKRHICMFTLSVFLFY